MFVLELSLTSELGAPSRSAFSLCVLCMAQDQVVSQKRYYHHKNHSQKHLSLWKYLDLCVPHKINKKFPYEIAAHTDGKRKTLLYNTKLALGSPDPFYSPCCQGRVVPIPLLSHKTVSPFWFHLSANFRSEASVGVHLELGSKAPPWSGPP